MKNIHIDINIDMVIFENVDIDIDNFKNDHIDIDIDIDIFQKCRYIDNRYVISIYRTGLEGGRDYDWKAQQRRGDSGPRAGRQGLGSAPVSPE